MSWDSDDISDRKGIIKDYWLRRRREILIAQEILRNFRRRARELIAEEDERKMHDLLDKLVKLGLLKSGQGLDDVLALTINDILERRLQTIVWKKGLATTPKQARQFIVHDHVYVSGHKVSVPGYIVLSREEDSVRISDHIKVEESAGES